jgi:SPP1 gp7 family putative phage head morphogenesis protein
MEEASKESVDIATRRQVLLERYKSGEVAKAEEDSSKAEESILALLLAAGFSNAKDLKKKELNALAREIARTVEALNEAFVSSLMDGVEGLSASEARYEVASIRRILGEAADLKNETAVFSYGMNRPMGHTGETVRDFLKKWKRSEIEAYENAIRKIWVDGEGLQDAIDLLRGTKSLGFSDGLTAKINNWRATNINTLVQHFSMSSKISVWLENGIERYQWISILDSRTTPICRGRSRKVYEVGNGPIPPAHFNCRSTIVFLENE